MDRLTEFLAKNPHIRYVTPSSPDFADIQRVFVIDETIVPAMVVQPCSEDDVAALVSLLAANHLPFSVRVGGHDMFVRSQVHNGITIDLRQLAHIHVDRETHTVRLGGGVLTKDLVKELQRHGMVVPQAIIPNVGYVGWATYGGYGPLSAEFGLGADQILAAKVVDAQGRIRDADEDMLTVIRGGGGSLGVIVELTTRAYPLDQVLAGIISYESSNLGSTIRQFYEGYHQLKKEGLPPCLGLWQTVLNGSAGISLNMFFVWASSDLDAGRAWLSKICACAPVASNTVAPTTMADFNTPLETAFPSPAHTTAFTANVRELTPEVVDVIVTYARLLHRNPGSLLGIHELRAGVTQPRASSVVGTRCPHFVLEILPLTVAADEWDDAKAWGQQFYDAVMKTDPANILPSSYIPLTDPKKADMKAIYGDRYETLERIKRQYDPQNVFRNALVRL